MSTELSCALIQTRPIQEMSDTTAALRAARDAGADTAAPEMYREASEWFQKARQEYRLKNFSLALDYLNRARKLAEESEFEVLRGTRRTSPPPTTPTPIDSAESNPTEPYPYPTPTGTPLDEAESRERDSQQQASSPPSAKPTGAGGGLSTPPVVPTVPER